MLVGTVVGVSSGKCFRGVMNIMNTDISKYCYCTGLGSTIFTVWQIK